MRISTADGILDRAFAGSDSILAAELAAAARLARELALPDNRVGLVTFSSTRSGSFSPGGNLRAATLVTPLTADAGALGRGVDAIRAQIPRGMTHTAAALDEARRALVPRPGDEGRGRIVLLSATENRRVRTRAPPRNLQATLEAAAACADLDIRVHTFAVGPEALANPEALVKIAENTRGFFTPVEQIAELPYLASRVARGSVRALQVSNRTTGEPASDLLLGNRRFLERARLRPPGPNVIEVSATALGGASAPTGADRAGARWGRSADPRRFRDTPLGPAPAPATPPPGQHRRSGRPPASGDHFPDAAIPRAFRGSGA